ncbi:MAG: DUF3300 domain-containing protein [Burkholderiaceae bacterium]|nr:DUF3300 domain-containing protein [Burkholderiaceae bacterium]
MKIVHRLTILVLALSLGWLPLAISQSVDNRQTSNSQALNNAPLFSSQEIDVILAPIALYPDALLSQVLMASTYLLEVVQAARWSKSNNNKGGDAAVIQVSGQPWDPSVQSLVAFPQVLAMMSDQLDWTQKLGDAFLAQQADVMDSVQRLRRQAQQAGNLSSNAQQTLVTQGQIVVIEPAQPNVIYVPAHNPTIVYGAWPAPAYPPVYYPGVSAWYPGQSFVNGLMWGTGVIAAGAIFGGFNWNNHDVNINVNNYNRLNHNNFYNGTGNNWRHNPQHRGTVAYRDNASRQRYSSNAGAAARNDYRVTHQPRLRPLTARLPLQQIAARNAMRSKVWIPADNKSTVVGQVRPPPIGATEHKHKSPIDRVVVAPPGAAGAVAIVVEAVVAIDAGRKKQRKVCLPPDTSPS